MINFEELDEKIEEYKKMKVSRPKYKNALIDKKHIEFMIYALTRRINDDFLSDEEKDVLNVKIKKNTSLLFNIEIYIIKCKIKFNME